MTILSFSWDGDDSTGPHTFTIGREYRFKSIKLKSIEWVMNAGTLSDAISGSTSGVDQSRTIHAMLGVKFGFCDSKDVVHYESASSAETLTTGLVPFGFSQNDNSDSWATGGMQSRNFHDLYLVKDRPQKWTSTTDITLSAYFRGVETDGAITAWAVCTATEFDDASYINVTIELC